jgi:hypothetical protein
MLSTQDILPNLQVSSVPLVTLTSENMPGSMASGCLLDYDGSRLVVTVEHAIIDGQTLAVELGWDAEQRQVKLCKLNPTTVRLTKLIDGFNFAPWADLDFAYCKFPVNEVPQFQQLDESGKILSARPCTIWTEAAIKEPEVDGLYGFAGRTQGHLEDHRLDVKFFATKLQVCYPIRFVGEAYGLYKFQLPGEHPGDKFFKGCSGAPIVDLAGNVVALVVGGRAPEPAIYGFPINRYKVLFDVEAKGLAD